MGKTFRIAAQFASRMQQVAFGLRAIKATVDFDEGIAFLMAVSVIMATDPNTMSWTLSIKILVAISLFTSL
uniref:ABC transmembrane type-1 domain-containing protein n=1 Tax=Syphacia muris TaxID=451379 RepID=A0A0N5ATK7_9BILA